MKIQTEGKISITKIAEDVHKVFSKWNRKSDHILFAKSKTYKYNGVEICLDPEYIVLPDQKHITSVWFLDDFLFCVDIPLSASKEEIANLFREEFNKNLLNLYNKVDTLEKMLGVEKK